MKKILFLLLISIASYGQADFPEGINLGGNTATAESSKIVSQQPGTGELNYINATALPVSTAVQGSLDTKENVANKSDSYTTSSSTAYVSGKALVEGLGTKQNTLTNPVTGTFVAGRVPYSSSNSTLTDSSKLLWNNTNSYFEVNGNAPRFTLKNNLNNYSTYFTNNANGILFLKNHQDKTLAVFSNPVNSTSQPQMAIGNVSSIPTESQLYVYGGMNGANIDARGSATVDEANIDLEGNDWTTSPNSLGFSYFGSSATAFGTMMGYAKNKLGVIRFQDTNYAIINSDKSTGISPIRFGINQIEIGNVNDKGFSYKSDFSSNNISNPRWLTDKAYVDAGLATKQNTITNPITGTGTANYISKWMGDGTQGNSLIYDNGTNVGIGTSTPNRKLEVSDLDNQLSLKGYVTGAPTYQSWFNSSNTRRGYFGFSSNSNSDIKLVNEENGNIYISPSNGSTIITSSVMATSYTGSATLTGTPTAPTAAPGTNTTQIATTAFVDAGLATKQNTITNPTTGAGSNLDPNAYALQDGTILYHSVKWFAPTGAVSTSGTTVTSVGTQFTSAMVGAKLTINGEWRIITVYTSSTVVTVASAYSQNYSGVVAGNWGVFSRSYISRLPTALDYQSQRFFDRLGKVMMGVDDNIVRFEDLGQQSTNSMQIYAGGIFLGGSRVLQWSNNTSGINEVGGAKDLGLRRNSAGLLELYNGVTANGSLLNRRDLLVRNVYSEPATLPNQAVTKAQLDLKADLASPTLTGTPTAPTAAPGTTGNQIATLDYVQATRPYKVYTALLSQTGTNAPTAIVLENTIGAIVWTRVNPGFYSGTLTGAFTTDKTILLNNNPVGGVFTNTLSSVNTITIQTRNYSNAQTDDGLSNTSIEIRVYN